jgi:hypothetical protein
MVSETSPYLWASVAALFLGLSCGQALRAFVRVGEAPATAARRRPRRIALAITYLSLGILALVGLLVLSYRSPAQSGGLRDAVERGGAGIVWAVAMGLLCLLAGFRPIVLGAPVAALFAAVAGLVALGLEGWLPLRPAAEGPVEIARFLPFEVGPGSSRGQLELSLRDSLPVVQALSLSSASLSVAAESIGLSGPLGFLADLVRPAKPARASTAASELRRFYRLAGLVEPGAAIRLFPAAGHPRLLDALLPPIAEGLGLEPGGETAKSSGIFRLAERRRSASPAAPLLALEPVSFGLREDGSVQILR